jgi:Uma2 family endonuclease
MNVQLPMHMEKPAFLAWVQAREERYELVEGRVIIMTGATRAHGLVVSNLIGLMRDQLDPHLWSVIPEFGIDAGPRTLRYADVMVEAAGQSALEYETSEPVLLVEVLSPSTMNVDLRDKPAEYLRLPRLEAYVIFAQIEHKAYVWIREAGNFPAVPTEISGRDEAVRVAALNLTLPLAAVYEGVVSS